MSPESQVFEARDVSKARAVAQELCRILSAELEMNLKH